MSNDIEIKLCPKCGGEPVIVRANNGRYQVMCWWDLSCCYHTVWHSTKEEAIAEWNRNNSMPTTTEFGEISNESIQPYP